MTIREYIKRTLQEPLKRYHTPIQDAILELMTEFFELYHTKIQDLPSIITPSKYRVDILDAIAKSYGFVIRPEADINEQINILANIGYVYKVRGSIYSIEHMKSLYGGNLPDPVHIEIPSYGLFKYNISSYDGNDVYQDGEYNRPGTYHVYLENYSEDVDVLVEWMYKELVTSGALIHVMNKITSSYEMSLQDRGVIERVHHTPEELFNSRLYLTVTDTEGNIVALKSVDEYRYVTDIPSDYASRVLKYDDPDSDGYLYYIELEDTGLSVQYGFSRNTALEPIQWTTLGESKVVEPTDSVLWLKLIVSGMTRTVPVVLKDIGVDWYIQYAKVGDELIDWVIWSDQDYSDPNKVVYTADPSKAKGLYIRTDLTNDYPLCTYNLVSVYMDPDGTKEIMRSAGYSPTGLDEYADVGTFVASVPTSVIKRSKNMTDVIELILMAEEDENA